jgi:diguanylate cyclase (GGDEF)-like protein
MSVAAADGVNGRRSGRPVLISSVLHSGEGAAFCLLIGGVLSVACVGAYFGDTPFPELAQFGPMALFAAVICDVWTAVILLGTLRQSRSRRSAIVLALSFLISAVLTSLDILVLPLPSGQAILAASLQTGPWLYACWHVSAAVGGLACILLRRESDTDGASRRFVVTSVLVAAAILISDILLSFVFVARLPVLIVGTTYTALSTDVGPFTIGILVVATLAAFRVRRPAMIDRMLAITLLALSLDSALLWIGARRYTGTFYASRLLLLGGSMFVLMTAIGGLVASRARLTEVESTLLLVEGEAAKRANRIRALWEMASESAPVEGDTLRNILATAAATIRPGKSIFGALSHLESGAVVVDQVSRDVEPSDAATTGIVRSGATYPLERTILSLLPPSGGTRFWDDLRTLDERGLVVQQLGWGCFIGTLVTIAERTYYISFGSTEPMLDEPFAEDDVAYVEVVASFLASRITQQLQFDQIQFEIEHDALTGLQNRNQFRNAVREEIAERRSFSIALTDIDGFRHVNAQEGHQAGDALLVEVATGLNAVADHDLVARMSADEFGILLRGSASATSAGASIERYSELFHKPFRVGAFEGANLLGVSASIGVARYPDDGASVEDLIRRAAVALKVAKSGGGSTTVHYDDAMETLVQESHLRIVELSDAIAKDQLALVYQPTFDLATRAYVGAEALVRWDHPSRGRLSPAEFIDFADRNGLMGPLSSWVLDRVVRDVSRGESALPPGFRVYFNLAPRMLDDVPFISKLNEILKSAPGLARHLGVEVTESAAMENVERSMHTIELFRRWGLSVAIDDFGTGHSSLAYLKQLTVDVIKIDRSFVMGLPDDERDAALADMLLRISDRFGFTTLAEGIETEAQAAWLLEHGCRLGQGYLIARPGPYADLLAEIARSLQPPTGAGRNARC